MRSSHPWPLWTLRLNEPVSSSSRCWPKKSNLRACLSSVLTDIRFFLTFWDVQHIAQPSFLNAVSCSDPAGSFSSFSSSPHLQSLFPPTDNAYIRVFNEKGELTFTGNSLVCFINCTSKRGCPFPSSTPEASSFGTFGGFSADLTYVTLLLKLHLPQRSRY